MWDWIGKAAELRQQGRPFALVTVLETKGSTPREAGAKMIVEPSGAFAGTIGGGQLEKIALDDARAALAGALGGTRRYPLCFRTGQCCGGSVEVLVELIGTGPILCLFGAGHVGQSLLQTMSGTSFQLHVVDERAEWCLAAAIPSGVVRHQVAWREAVAHLSWDRMRTHVLIMTHDHGLDLEVLRAVLDRPARYIGLIGSETKWSRFKQRLAALGADADQIARVRCPIGVGSFGKAPREVAISVAAELLALHAEQA